MDAPAQFRVGKEVGTVSMAPTPAPSLQLPGIGKWAVGIAGTWLGLAVLVEIPSTRVLGVALGWAIVGGVVLVNWPKLQAALPAGNPAKVAA